MNALFYEYMKIYSQIKLGWFTSQIKLGWFTSQIKLGWFTSQINWYREWL